MQTEQSLNQSPTAPVPVPDPVGRFFYMMIVDLLQARAIRRLSWPKGEQVSIKTAPLKADSSETADVLILKKADGSEHLWIVARLDLEGVDWVTVS